MGKTGLYALSFFTNATILVFEIAGGRLLAPYLGTSVGVWAGLIAVVLGGMAVGYHFGGRFADKDSSKKRIAVTLFAAGCAALLAWSLRDLIPTWIAGMEMRVTISALIVSTLLFLPTVILLAALSPMIVKNLLKRIEDSAKVVGELNAVGTVGSIVGAIGTGLWLIPHFDGSTILLVVAAFLLLGACTLSLDAIKKFFPVFLIVSTFAFFLNGMPTRTDTLIADITTPYNRIFVGKISEHGRAVVVSNSPYGWQCGMFIEPDGTVQEKELVFSYHEAQAAFISEMFPEGPSRALFLGGCIESFPRYFLRVYPEAKADSVEIDPGMTDVARKYFDFDESAFPTLTIHYEDARMFVNREHQPYDLILLDAWGSSGKPSFHLASKEMFEGMHRSLAEKGIVVVNVIGTYGSQTSYLTASYVKTARSVFPYVALYEFTERPEDIQNMVMVMSKSADFPDSFKSENLHIKKVEPASRGIVLTDDYAPIEGFTDWKRLTD